MGMTETEIKDDAGCATMMGYLTMTVIMLAFGCAFNGWVLAKIWAWIITPTFHLPALTVAQAVGLSLVYNFITNKPDLTKQNAKGSLLGLLLTAMISTVVGGLAVLGIASLVCMFM
jgi:hypothetical protein